MKKMSVFIYSMGGGGAERVISNLLGFLAKKFELHLILQNSRVDYELPDNVRVHLLENSAPFESGLIKLLKIPLLALKYKRLCDEIGIDIHFVFMNRPCYIAALARIFGLRGAFIFSERSTPSLIYQNAGIKGLVNKFLIKKLYVKADFIYPNSSGALLDLRDNYGISEQKMSVLYNALNLDKIKALKDENLGVESLENERFFLSIGRLDEGKNHELLIRAYARLKENRKNAPKLVILGSGVLEEHLKSVIKELGLDDSVYLLGFNKNPYKFLAKCEAFVFLSRFEGFANVLIEAMACGALVISSEHKSGAKELIGDDEYGILVPVGDLEKSQKAMERVLDEPTLKELYKPKALKRANDFDMNKIANELISELESFL